MTQSDSKRRTTLGLEPFLEKPSSNSPILWEKWRSQLKITLVAKTNNELDELLQERPTQIIYPPELLEDQPVQNPTRAMERERQTRYHQAIAKWKNECNQQTESGYYEAINHGTWQTGKPNRSSISVSVSKDVKCTLKKSLIQTWKIRQQKIYGKNSS